MSGGTTPTDEIVREASKAGENSLPAAAPVSKPRLLTSHNTPLMPSLELIEEWRAIVQSAKSTSVSALLQETMPIESKKRIWDWQADKKRTLGAEQAQTMHQARLNTGKDFHKTMKLYMQGKMPGERESEDPHWKSFIANPEYTNLTPVSASLVEATIKHPKLNYSGRLDAVGLYKGTPHLIDWKTSSKEKPTSEPAMLDYYLQVAAYLGALNCDVAKHKLEISRILLAICYDDGSPAEFKAMDGAELEKHWDMWLERVEEFRLQNERKSTSASNGAASWIQKRSSSPSASGSNDAKMPKL